MSTKERQLLLIFAVLTVLVLLVNVFPALYKQYQQEQEELAQMHLRLEAYRKLLGTDAQWQEKLNQAQKRKQIAEQGLFSGETREIIDARMQSQVKKLAQEAGVKIESIGLAEYTHTNEWLMVNKRIRFSAKTAQLVKLLTLLQKAKPKLTVIGLDVRVNRKILRGTFKVVGFSRLKEAA